MESVDDLMLALHESEASEDSPRLPEALRNASITVSSGAWSAV